MIVLITGAGGFVGSHTLKLLLQKTDIQTVPVFLSEDEIPDWFDRNQPHEVGNLSDISFCKKIIDGVEIVIHLAAVINGDNDSIFRCNIETFERLLRLSVDNGVQRFIYASSASVYKASPSKIDEGFEKEPKSFYALSKHIDDCIANYYMSLSKMKIIGLRYFNIFGADNINSRDVVSKFFKKALQNSKIQINGKNTSRDFIGIDDIANINSFFALKKTIESGFYNIGLGIPQKINSIAQYIISITNSSSEIEVVEDVENNSFSCSNNNKLLQIIDFKLDEDVYKQLDVLFSTNKEKWLRDINR